MTKPFSPAGTKRHYTPDRPVGVDHVRLDLDLDLLNRLVKGTSTLSFTVRRDGLTQVVLHAVEMVISAVRMDGQRPLPFQYDGQQLTITLPRPQPRGEKLILAVDYQCSPRRGLYFLGPDESDPQRPLQCWTQGQDEDSRHYWPGVDFPIEKASSEVICTVARGNLVLSNGELLSREDRPDDRIRWHYRLDFPHAGYLITLVCGPFVEVRDVAPETGVELCYYVPPGREADARRTFGRTPAMVDHFSKRIGVPYPHKRYSQIVVADFIFGGMENTSATTLTDQCLLDERAALDHDMDSLISHELAHQWWGDLITCREWPEAWLNEGFATYFEYVWRDHAKGRDEADHEYLADAEAYLGETERYLRPIVERRFDEPMELFDAHLYEKGGRVLHMLRHEMGDEVFWRMIRMYAERHARGSVETRDLARVAEEASGRNFDLFFDQWIGTAGHPELEASWEWDEERRVGTLRLEQKQEGDAVFHFTTRVRFETGGAERDETLTMKEKVQSFDFPLPARPTQVIFDPGDVILKTLKWERPLPLLIRQLTSATLGVDRVLAARALGDRPDPSAIAALRDALERDSFWAVRAAAARALGKTRRDEALQTLRASRDEAHPKVRRAVAEALGEFRGDERAAETLAAWAEGGDPSAFVEAAAALALGKTRSPRALRVLPLLLSRRSFQDVVRARALEGLGCSGQEEALSLIRAEYRPQASFQVRRAALGAATTLAEGTPAARKAREFLESGLDDRDFRVRMDAGRSLGELGDARAVEALEGAWQRELDGRARRRMRESMTSLHEKGKPPEQVRKLGDELERLRSLVLQLRERLDKVEQAAPGRGGPDSASGGGGRPVRTRRRPRPGSQRTPPKPRRPSRPR